MSDPGFTFPDCFACAEEDVRSHVEWSASKKLSHVHGVMFVCPECGNKRCPKATDHENACTGSNATGQVGSRYERVVDA